MPPPTLEFPKKTQPKNPTQNPSFHLVMLALRWGLPRCSRAFYLWWWSCPGAGTDPPHGPREWLQLLLISGNQAVFIGLCILVDRLLNTQVWTFFASLSQLLIFSQPACLFNMMLGALAMCLVRITLFLQVALLALLVLWMVLLLGKRRGRLEKLQIEVVVPLPKKINKKIYGNEFLILVQRGRRNSPLVPERDWKKKTKREKRGF